MEKSILFLQNKIAEYWLDMDMKFLIYKAKTLFLTVLEDVLSEKIVIKCLGTPRMVILEVVADHQYHSSRLKWGCWDFPNL